MNELIKTLSELNLWSVTFRVFLSALLGGFIGLERGHHGRAAGLRTHILVCLGATVASLIGLYSALVLHFNSDPLRVGAQVVSGVGFLGVGTIMIRNREHVTGLTTAAGLWATACIGLSIGIGFYLVSILAFLVVMISFLLLGQIERFKRKKDIMTCYVEFTDTERIKEFYEKIENFASVIDIVPAKSGLPHHVGLEIRTETAQNYKILYKMAQDRKDVLIALPSQVS